MIFFYIICLLEFQNDVAKFYCSVYFAEQFRQLREQIFPEGEERFELLLLLLLLNYYNCFSVISIIN